MTKAQLRDIYLQWARQELDSIYLIEAVGAHLGNPEKKPPSQTLRVKHENDA